MKHPCSGCIYWQYLNHSQNAQLKACHYCIYTGQPRDAVWRIVHVRQQNVSGSALAIRVLKLLKRKRRMQHE